MFFGAIAGFEPPPICSKLEDDLRPVDESTIRAIVRRVLDQSLAPVAAEAEERAGKTVAIGADHGGYELKEALKHELAELGYGVADVGAHSQAAVDYPDIALAVARQVSSGAAWRGVIIDGAGIGSCMAANKVPGVRAALAYDHASAVNSREHNDANVLTLGAGLIGLHLAKQILKTWLATEFAGGRHARRVEKISQIERQFLK
jgi:ribose 5-phosphate isomerase B